MKKRSKAGGKASKARHRNALKPKRRDASKTASSSVPIEDTQVARLTRELNEALEQQAATSEVLGVISAFSGEPQRVFQSMLENATRLCDAKFGMVFCFDGDAFVLAAEVGTPPAFAEYEKRRGPFKPVQGSHLDRVMRTKAVSHTADYAAEGIVAPPVKLGGARSTVDVPMLRGNELIGAFSVYRQEVRPFTEKQIALVANFAAQAVIAIENARLLNELTQSLEQQTATSQVLQIISSSPSDLEPVFQAMLENATRICEAKFGVLYRYDGQHFSLATHIGAGSKLVELMKRGPITPHPDTILGRLVVSKEVLEIEDARKERGYLERNPVWVAGVEEDAAVGLLGVPMLKENALVGAFVIFRPEVRPFTDKQIALVKNFAAQAVIAIENGRLLNELRQRTTDLTERTADLTEALEQQTATSEVLQVISSSPGDLQPVFYAMVEAATRICNATFGGLFRVENNTPRIVAALGLPQKFVEFLQSQVQRVGPHNAISRLIKTRRIVHIADYSADQAYLEGDPVAVAGVELGGIRTLLNVPMLKDGELIGLIGIFRQDVRPFTDKQVELMKNFANQAVIAIENARLLNELRQRTTDLSEALEQQTATSEVLRVISSSPGDLQPVFETMLANAVRICDAKWGNIHRWDGDALHLLAAHNTPPAFAETRGRSPNYPASDTVFFGRVIATKMVAHVADAAAERPYIERSNTAFVAAVELGGARTSLAVPMLKENELIGTLALARQEVRPFTDKQIELVKNFAAQAVIAIENARLLNELRQRTSDLSQRTTDLTEALEQQTATSDVLEVISRSAFDLQAVFETVAESSVRLCGADRAFIFRFDGELLRMVVGYNSTPGFVEWVAKNPIRPGRHSGSARAALERRTIHIADVLADPEYVYGAKDVEPIRTVLGVPILKGDDLLGVMMIYRLEVRPFTDRQIALVETFADQAAIAIENVRLLDELRERTEEVEKLNQHLEQRVTDQVGEIERMSRLRRFLPPQVADLIVASGTEKQLESHRREITALFCDLRGFTGFTESADAEDVMALLREYHATVGEKIIKYSGTLERYAGDGVMVVFNDPVPVENPALQAVLMALEVRDAIGALTEKWHRLGHDIGFGIGIAHGFATLGTIGFEGRFDYAAIGTVSNVASRLCDEAKPGQILISPRVLMAVEDAVKVEPVGEFELKGIRRPLAAYNVLGACIPYRGAPPPSAAAPSRSAAR